MSHTPSLYSFEKKIIKTNNRNNNNNKNKKRKKEPPPKQNKKLKQPIQRLTGSECISNKFTIKRAINI